MRARKLKHMRQRRSGGLSAEHSGDAGFSRDITHGSRARAIDYTFSTELVPVEDRGQVRA
jgi:hypothetical protein